MAYFSRLTEIVTCNLTALLEGQEDPVAALAEIADEMREGVEGATRSVGTADRNVQKLESEVGEVRKQIGQWTDEAKALVEKNDEAGARNALIRRQECQAVVDGLEQQLQSAIATRDHLRTTLRALEARLADALRKQAEVGTPEADDTDARSGAARHDDARVPEASSEIDLELAALKREMGVSD